MNRFVSTLKSQITNPTVSDERKNAVLGQLRELAGNKSDPRCRDAVLTLRELTSNDVCTENGQVAPAPPADTADACYAQALADSIQRAREIINNPQTTEAGRKQAWGIINDPQGFAKDVDKLEKELLEELSAPTLQEAEYAAIRRFVSDKQWSETAKGLFDRWRALYWQTEEGIKKLQQLETYKLMHDAQRRGDTPETNAIDLLATVRRRIRTSPEFRKMLTAGVKTEADADFVRSLVVDIWSDEPEPHSEPQTVAA